MKIADYVVMEKKDIDINRLVRRDFPYLVFQRNEHKVPIIFIKTDYLDVMKKFIERNRQRYPFTFAQSQVRPHHAPQ